MEKLCVVIQINTPAQQPVDSRPQLPVTWSMALEIEASQASNYPQAQTPSE